MIKSVQLHRFKSFKDKTINLKQNGVTLLAGSNNSGKSSLLHAIAVWEFCKTILSLEKGSKVLFQGNITQGYGISADEFLPIALPSLKHLWTNLKTQKIEESDGYTLTIGCGWNLIDKQNCYLEFGLSLVNDRLFIKTTKSNLEISDNIPKTAYLPTFAGIVEKERKMSVAERTRQIGKGLAGSVIRNLLLDMFEKNKVKRSELKGNKSKISASDLEALRRTDPWELLVKALREVFNTDLVVEPFNDIYQSYINVMCYKGAYLSGRFRKHNGYSNRDIMVEGSGFLQWLSVYSLAVNSDISVLLLDEPDAHLHSSLQTLLLDTLESIAIINNKQVLIATHSAEIIKNISCDKIMNVNKGKMTYLNSDEQKIGLLAGLGSEYSPRIHKLQIHKRMLIVENESDAKLLKIWCEKLEVKWPENLVVWSCSAGHKERKHLFLELKKEIPELQAISLRDRDDEPYNTVGSLLEDHSHSQSDVNLKYRKWRRRHIENYLMSPNSISRATEKDVVEIQRYFEESHALAIPPNFQDSIVPSALYDSWGKEIISTGTNSIEKTFNCNKFDIAKEMVKDEICEDSKIIIEEIINFC